MDVHTPSSDLAEVTGVKFNIRCRENYNHIWGVYLNADGSLPEGWDICIKCSSIARRVKESVQNGHNTDPQELPRK